MKKRYSWLILTILVLLAMFAGCFAQVPSAEPSSAPAPSSGAAPAVVPASSSSAALEGIEGVLENIYTQVNPSVVNIQVAQNLGSGFVWDKEGNIVTNNHVVAGADNVSVTFSDDTTVPGKVVGTDVDSDLAVVKVDISAGQLKPVQMADSTQVKVGQVAIAIGNPFALQGTMTVGIISALGRSLPVESDSIQGAQYTIPDVIQTDASINPGNSGGVLVDHEGKVVGVTSAIISSLGTSSGIGFAIPSAIVQKVVPSLIKTGHYAHPWLGVIVTSLTPDFAAAMNLKADQRGALVIDITAGGPADKAGIKGGDHLLTIQGQQVNIGGDVIIAIDEQPLKGTDDLIAYLSRHTDVGQTVTLTILRHGQEQKVPVTLASRPTT